jgi:hypothetical protein
VRTIDASAEDPAFCIYGDLFGSCPGPMWGVHVAPNLATTPPTLQVIMGSCNCSGGGCIQGGSSISVARTYELAISDAGGPYSAFAVLQDGDWVNNAYEHTFAEGHENAMVRMRVFEGATRVGEAYSLYPVYLPATVAVGELRDLRTLTIRSFPNPFVDLTRIAFTLDGDADVHVSVYDAAGRSVADLHDGTLAPGEHRLSWDGRRDDGSRAASGVYTVVARTARARATREIVLVGRR